MKSDGWRIGVDLGGSKIEAVAINASGAIKVRERRPTPAGDYRKTIAAIVDLVHSVERQIGMDMEPVPPVGIGIPGSISPATGLVRNANSTCLIGHPLDRDLAAALGRPVRVENDANCFAISEATDGAAAGERVVFGVILGTGVGGGLVVDGRILTGRNRVGGEWGHNPLPWAQRRRAPRPAMLLWSFRLHRDLPLRSRTGRRLCGVGRRGGRCGGYWRRSSIGRRPRGSRHRPLRGTAGTRAGHGDQCNRPRRHCSWRRAVEPDASLRDGAEAVEAMGLLGLRPHPPLAPASRGFQRGARRCLAMACRTVVRARP